jgi:hypothetical protein
MRGAGARRFAALSARSGTQVPIDGLMKAPYTQLGTVVLASVAVTGAASLLTRAAPTNRSMRPAAVARAEQVESRGTNDRLAPIESFRRPTSDAPSDGALGGIAGTGSSVPQLDGTDACRGCEVRLQLVRNPRTKNMGAWLVLTPSGSTAGNTRISAETLDHEERLRFRCVPEGSFDLRVLWPSGCHSSLEVRRLEGFVHIAAAETERDLGRIDFAELICPVEVRLVDEHGQPARGYLSFSSAEGHLSRRHGASDFPGSTHYLPGSLGPLHLFAWAPGRIANEADWVEHDTVMVLESGPAARIRLHPATPPLAEPLRLHAALVSRTRSHSLDTPRPFDAEGVWQGCASNEGWHRVALYLVDSSPGSTKRPCALPESIWPEVLLESSSTAEVEVLVPSSLLQATERELLESTSQR